MWNVLYKEFRLLKDKITFHGSINQLWTVTCLFCNFLLALIQNRSSEDIWVENIKNPLCKTLKNGTDIKILEKFSGNIQKQHHTMTGVSRKYLYYSSETPVMKRHCFMRSLRNLPQTSWTAIPENKFNREIVLDD